MVPTGLSQAATVRVGLAAGARDAEGLVRAGWIAVIMAVCFGTCSGGLFWLLAPQLIGLFVPDAASPVFALAVSYLAMARSEEHTSELPSLMRISYSVFCLKK